MIAKACSHRHRRWSSNEAGQVLVLVALAIFVLIGFVALAADVGFYRYKKRDMQKAADAGAIGGATERIYNVGNIDFGAKRDTSINGYTHNPNDTDSLKRVIVTVNNPPLSGPHKDLTDRDHYVEVIIDQDQPTFFARIFNIDSVKVRARAVAYGGSGITSAEACVWALNPDAGPAFQIQGSGGGSLTNTTVDADCNVYVSSTDPDNALQVQGGATLNADNIGVAGGTKYQSGFVNVDEDGEFLTGVEGIPVNPLMAKTPPDYDPNNCTNFIDNGASTITLDPGTYCGGIQIGGAGRTVYFNDGLYVLYGGGLRIQAGNDSKIYGGESGGPTGVTFYNTGSGPPPTDGSVCVTCYGSVHINAGAETNFYAPRAGDLAGMLFWQDLANTQQATFNGNSNTTLEGALYFPSATAVFDGGNSTEAGYTVLIADKIKFSGGAIFHIANVDSPLDPAGSGEDPPTPRVVLVE